MVSSDRLADGPDQAGQHRRIEFHAWQAGPLGSGREGFESGHLDGAVLGWPALSRPVLGGTGPDGTGAGEGAITFGWPAGRRSFADPFIDAADGSVTEGPAPRVDYDTCTWTGPLHRPGFGAQEVIVSFNARTPGRSWVEMQIQVTTGPDPYPTDPYPTDPYRTDPYRTDTESADPRGLSAVAPTPGSPAPGPDDAITTSRWFTMARWCQDMPLHGGAIHRASVGGQGDDNASIATDTLIAAPGRRVTGYRLRATLLRPHGGHETPTVTLLGAVASRLPAAAPAPTGPAGPQTGPGAGRELHVETLSQMTHKGQYPQWGGGGESWCSPTSVAMAMGYHHAGPERHELAWVEPPADAIVAFSARATWDHRYRGAGNWAFSTAYPGCYGLEAFVTRLTSLCQAEAFIAAGIPLVASVRFMASELDGAGYSTDGHLLLIVGFTDAGDVIVDDPASHDMADDDQVRVVYRRDQFEDVWLSGSGGTVYVIHPPRLPLPSGAATGI